MHGVTGGLWIVAAIQLGNEIVESIRDYVAQPLKDRIMQLEARIAKHGRTR